MTFALARWVSYHIFSANMPTKDKKLTSITHIHIKSVEIKYSDIELDIKVILNCIIVINSND